LDNLPESFLSLAKAGCSGDIVINKSRFIGYAKMAMDEKESLQFIEAIKSEHPLASVICYGYVCGYQSQIQKYHDGHEPVGGKPILSAIKLKELTGVTCAVVRYFGGVKLGVGGLARAFSSAAAAAIDDGTPSLYELGKELEITYDYHYDGKVAYLMENSTLEAEEKKYYEKISVTVHIKNKFYEAFIGQLSAITNGTHAIKVIEEKYMC